MDVSFEWPKERYQIKPAGCSKTAKNLLMTAFFRQTPRSARQRGALFFVAVSKLCEAKQCLLWSKYLITLQFLLTFDILELFMRGEAGHLEFAEERV